MRRLLHSLSLFIVLTLSSLGAEINVATLNCLLLFDPAIEHAGEIDNKEKMSAAEYQTKLQNLVSLCKGYEVIGLQETGGRTEIEALAKLGGYDWAFAKGKDTKTGEEVGALYHLPGWKVFGFGRVNELDRQLSKHLTFVASKDSHRIHFLVIHLIRPIGPQAEKHDRQIAAINQWAAGIREKFPKDEVVVLGDTNDDKRSALFNFGTEAGASNGWSATHLKGKPFDRMTALLGKWKDVEVKRPPYGPKPNKVTTRVWTDHFLLGGTLVLP